MVLSLAHIVAALALVQVLVSSTCAQPETMYDLLTASGQEANDDTKLKYHEVYPGASNCHVTSQIPQPPRSLSFCHKFNDNACCVPQLDDENNDFFGQLTNLGLSCRIRGDIRVDPLATLYCLNCDPEQPSYIRLGMSSLNEDEDGSPAYSEAGQDALNGGDYSGSGTTGDPVGFTDPDGDKQTLLVDVEWARQSFKASPLLSGPDDRLSKCGLLVSVPCQGINPAGDSQDLDGRDRYMCGDDLIIPSNPDHGCLVFNASDEHQALVNASIEQFLNLPSLGTPLIDESFYFKLVVNQICTEEEARIYLNPHCLRSKDQIETISIDELKNNFNVTMTYKDWVCAMSGDASWVPTAADNDFCRSTVNCAVGGAAKEIAQAKLDNPCCCGTWKTEKAFSSAGGVQSPLLATILAVAVAFMFR